jgi:hypothetical protein
MGKLEKSKLVFRITGRDELGKETERKEIFFERKQLC